MTGGQETKRGRGRKPRGRGRGVSAKETNTSVDSDADVTAKTQPDVTVQEGAPIETVNAQTVLEVRPGDAQNEAGKSQTEAQIEAQDTTIDTEDSNVASKSKKPKVVISLCPEEEQSMIEWLEAHPIFYYKKLGSYKETAKKERMWADKAAEMEKSIEILKIWYQSLRSRYGRLMDKKPSGSEDTELTERDEWVLKNFDFLRPHIHRVQPRPTVSIKQKLSALSTDFDESAQDNTDQDSATDQESQASAREGPITTTRRRGNKTFSKAEDAFLAGLEERSQQMLALNQQVLDRLVPTSSTDREKDAFVDWFKSVIHELDHDLWRRCQQEISNILYRYIGENDQLKKQQISSAFAPSFLSQNKQSANQPQDSVQTCSAMWQPQPSQWPNQPTSSVSVWHSQDANWVAQQFPQQQTMTQLQPVRLAPTGTQFSALPLRVREGMSSTSGTASPVLFMQGENQFVNVSDPDPAAQEPVQMEQQPE